MAEARRISGLNDGNTGLITYIPRGESEDQIGHLRTGRLTSSRPKFHFLSTQQIYPPSKTQPSETASQLWEQRQLQKRWLFKSHPEVSMSTSLVQDILSEELKRSDEELGHEKPLIALGEMTDFTHPTVARITPLLAVACGESGELLRLARMETSQWHFGDPKDATLKFPTVETEYGEDQTTLMCGGSPITQIKFATIHASHDLTRWLLVQNQTTTLVFKPEYYPEPVVERPEADYLGPWPASHLSRVRPNLVLSVPHHRTGGNTHADAAIIPQFVDRPPQVAIIDGCGHWSVWNLLPPSDKDDDKMRKSLYKRGHIGAGALREWPISSSIVPKRHGILLVGAQTANHTTTSYPTDPFRRVLLWNHDQLELLHLGSDTRLDLFHLLSPKKGRVERILDVQNRPGQQHHVFILTSRNILWVDMSAGDGAAFWSRNKLILDFPHSMDGLPCLKMSICAADVDDTEMALVFVHSPKTKQMSTFSIRQSSSDKLAQWHRHIVPMAFDGGGSSPDSLEAIVFQPTPLSWGTRESSTSLKSSYSSRGVQYYQGIMLSRQLGVRYCIGASCAGSGLGLFPPTEKTYWSLHNSRRRIHMLRGLHRKRRKHLFTLPDCWLVAKDESPLVSSYTAVSEVQRPPSRVYYNFLRLCDAMQRSLIVSTEGSTRAMSTSLLRAVRQTCDIGIESGRLPLVSWLEISQGLDSNSDLAVHPEDISEAIRSVQDDIGENLFVNTPGIPDQAVTMHKIEHIDSFLCQLWVDSLGGVIPHASLAGLRNHAMEVAAAIFLSTRGVMVPSVALNPATGAESTYQSSQPTQSSFTNVGSSQATTMSIPSSPAVFGTTAPDEAVQRLQLLAPSLQPGKLGALKEDRIIKRWPVERGVGTQEYRSSVAIATEKQFDELRQRKQRGETRKKALAERYKRLSGIGSSAAGGRAAPSDAVGIYSTPAGPAQIMSSQAGGPVSSQSQGPFFSQVAMSQPVAGAFGDRKKAKKSKKRSGFR